MFPYRRHGAKKRGKGGAGGAARRSRGAPRTLPNSLRDLLPLLQSATKSLAQMLAGRAGVGGQLDHARNILAHAERLIADGMHNRLSPADREELFEQLARLRLTLADADAEAEVQAAEQPVPERPVSPPVDQERLKEMALALTRRRSEPYRAGPPRQDRPEPADTAAAARSAQDVSQDAVDVEQGAARDEAAEPERQLKPLSELPGRLVLSRPGGEAARRAVRAAAPAAVEAPLRPTPEPADDDAAPSPRDDVASASQSAPVTRPVGEPASPDSNGAAEQEAPPKSAKAAARRRRKRTTGLHEGWVIDEDGYVVPGPG